MLHRDCEKVSAEVLNSCRALAAISGTELYQPRVCGRQTQRTNIPSRTADEY